jgi:microcystin-dependent protein
MRHALALVASTLLAASTRAAAAPPVVPYRFTPSTPAHAAEVNANFQALSLAVGEAMPTGVILPFVGTVAPAGFVLCDGGAHPRTGDYALLFATIGDTYGSGDGSTTFNVPDLRGRFLVGAGKNASPALTNRGPLGATGGEEAHTLTAAESGVPAHTHPYGTGTVAFQQSVAVLAVSSGTFVPATGSVANAGDIGANGAANAAAAHNTLPPYVAVSWIIKL